MFLIWEELPIPGLNLNMFGRQYFKVSQLHISSVMLCNIYSETLDFCPSLDEHILKIVKFGFEDCNTVHLYSTLMFETNLKSVYMTRIFLCTQVTTKETLVEAHLKFYHWGFLQHRKKMLMN